MKSFTKLLSLLMTPSVAVKVPGGCMHEVKRERRRDREEGE
jgi:hypothetical protein